MPGGETRQARQLRRLPDRGVIAGVCAGIAERLNVDVLLIRIMAVVLTIGSGGLGAIFYVAAWLVIPPAESTPTVSADHPPATSRASRPPNS